MSKKINEECLKKRFAELFKEGSCSKEEFKVGINKALQECENSNQLKEENKQLKSILYQTISKIEAEFDPKEGARYGVRIVIDGEMYKKIREILNDFK